MSVNSTDPSTLFGGTWTQLKDRFLLGAGFTYTNGTIGGEATHTLTISEMPSHNHIVGKSSFIATHDAPGGYSRNFGEPTDYESWYTTGFNTSYTGGDKPHNNMPPYLVVYMWKRTA